MSIEDACIAELEAENAALRADNKALRAQVHLLVGGVTEMEERLAKDCQNNSTPPSRDLLSRTRSRRQRRHSGKKLAGQPRHGVETLHLVAIRDEAVEYRPAVCTSTTCACRKFRLKIAGSFCADIRSEAFARIRRYLASTRKQGVTLVAALQTVCGGQPFYPALD